MQQGGVLFYLFIQAQNRCEIFFENQNNFFLKLSL